MRPRPPSSRMPIGRASRVAVARLPWRARSTGSTPPPGTAPWPGCSGAPVRAAQRVGQPQVRAGHAAVMDQPAVQRDGDDDEETAEPTQAIATTDDPVTQQTAGIPVGTPQGETTGETTGGEGAVAARCRRAHREPELDEGRPADARLVLRFGLAADGGHRVAARTEAGSETATPSWQPQTWTPDGGTEEVISAQVKVAQVVELPVGRTSRARRRTSRRSGIASTRPSPRMRPGTSQRTWRPSRACTRRCSRRPQSDADKELDTVIAQAKTDNDTYDTGNHQRHRSGHGDQPQHRRGDQGPLIGARPDAPDMERRRLRRGGAGRRLDGVTARSACPCPR